MSLVRFGSVCALSLCLTGCLNSHTLIKVKRDGSGTVEQTMLMKPSKDAPFNDAEIKRTIERFGTGMRFVSSTPLTEGGLEGARVVYACDDINQVSLDPDPGVAGASDSKQAAGAKSSSPVKFALARDDNRALLTVNFEGADAQEVPVPANANSAPRKINPAMVAMLKNMLEGFKVVIDLEVDGTIVKTTADYVNGSRITLVELVLTGILEDETTLQELLSKFGPGTSLSTLRPSLKGIKGVKINHPIVTVEYR